MKRTLAALALALALCAPAQASTILQFTQTAFDNPFAITSNGATSTISAVNVPVSVVFDSGFCLVAGCGGATNGAYFLNLSANSTSAASTVGTTITQEFAGTISVTNGAINLLTVNFSDIFTGPVGASSNIAMGSSQPPDTFTGSSNVLDPLKLGTPRGFALSFSDWTPGLSTNGTTINSAFADATGTFNATPPDVAPVPEPASLVLLGTGLLGAVLFQRRRQRQA